MTNTKQQIVDILKDIDLEKRPAVSKEQKAAFSVLERDIADAVRELNKLHLQLWHASSHHDYHSVSLAEARQTLGDILRRLGASAE